MLWAALFLATAACSEQPEPRRPRAEPEPSATSEETVRRLPLTLRLIEDYALTSAELAELQIFLHGRVYLRRETHAGAREVTPQHRLRVLDGQLFDEVLIASDTPGVTDGAAPLIVSFDPDDPESGLAFETDDQGRFRLVLDRRPGDKHYTLVYGDSRYAVLEGQSAYLEIEEERLRKVLTKQKSLPGVLLPGAEVEGSEGGEGTVRGDAQSAE